MCEDGGEERCACEGQEEEETEHREDEDANAYAVLCGAFMDAYRADVCGRDCGPWSCGSKLLAVNAYGEHAATLVWTGLMRPTGSAVAGRLGTLSGADLGAVTGLGLFADLGGCRVGAGVYMMCGGVGGSVVPKKADGALLLVTVCVDVCVSVCVCVCV